MLYAYALVPCANENSGVRMAVSNQPEGGYVFRIICASHDPNHSCSRKTVQLKTDGTPSIKASVTALWGTKALDNVVDLDLSFDVQTEKTVLRRLDKERYPFFSYSDDQRHSYGSSPALAPLLSKSVA